MNSSSARPVSFVSGHSGLVGPPLRQMLQQATCEVHQRLHLHRGFAAIQDTSISLEKYQQLLVRLYGFYFPFEIATRITSERSQWLERDLHATHPDKMTLTAIPRCRSIPELNTPERLLGAMYVVEGSALGGRGLSANLDNLLGRGVREGRRFFEGRGSATGLAWRGWLARLEAYEHDPVSQSEVVGAALETFSVFEDWLNGWRTAAHE